MRSMTASEAAAAPTSTMSVEEAERVLREVRGAFHHVDADNPLRTPKSLDDVMAILRSDQMDLFDAGIKFAKQDGSKRARVLEGQLQIAWAEGQKITAQLLDSLEGELREEVLELRELEAADKLNEAEQKRLDRLEILLEDAKLLVPALSRLAPIHLAEGRKIAEGLVAEAEHDYEGYRVLADYARVRGDWARFDELVAKVEQLEPDSIGLLFLKGVATAEHERDFDAASDFMRKALAKEPKFARAQAKLFLFANGLDAKLVEYEKLKKLNPHHQIVTLVGPALQDAVEVRAAREKRERRTDWRFLRM